MEKAVKSVTGILVDALERSDHDVVVMGGDKIFMFHDKSPIMISIEAADNVIIKTKSGTYEYPPSALPPKKKAAATRKPKLNNKVPPLFKGYELKDIKKAATALGVEKIISDMLPNKPKRSDYIAAFAKLFAKKELADNLDLITSALTGKT